MALCTFIAFLFFLFLIRHPLMRLAGHAIVVDDSPRASDAIVMLGDDNYTADRAHRAAELIHDGWAPRVVASGRYLRPYMSVSQLEKRDLIADGVPGSAVILLPQHARDTREECTVIGRFLGQRGWKHVLLVTSNYHTRRADYICSRLMPHGTEMYVVAAKDSDYNPNHWWQTRQGAKLFFHEFTGLIVSAWEMRHNSVQTAD
ncbi:MAG TPA: YdcF family protein [Candidatus Acidoferrales bacterium]|nr:YdcF family protein [Candidatus Acidoferrales bacterium]